MDKEIVRGAIRERINAGDYDHRSIRFTLQKYYDITTSESVVKYWLNKILEEMG